jgi:4-amino-4-deoxy-L-arabinose transferase-like glycosyltransferase
LLSKLTALTFGPFLLGLVVFAALRSARGRTGWRTFFEVVVITGIATIALVVVLWPASWADPSGQFEVLRGTAGLASSPHQQFFLGEATSTPGPLFYFIVVPLRMTPWLSLLAAAGTVVALCVRTLRPYAVVCLAFAVVPWIVITFASKQFERYSLPVWPVAAVLVGLLVQWGATRSERAGARQARRFELVVVGISAAIIVYTMLVVPYGAAYANPLLGGELVAQEVILVGSDPGAAGEFIREREGPNCNDRRIATRQGSRLWFPCGRLVPWSSDLQRGDYLVLFNGEARRLPERETEKLRKRGRVVARIERRGVGVAEVILVDRAS